MSLAITQLDFTDCDFGYGAAALGSGYTIPANGLYDIQLALYEVVAVAGTWVATFTINRAVGAQRKTFAVEPTLYELSAGTQDYKIFLPVSVIALAGDIVQVFLTSPNAGDSLVDGHVLIAQRTLAVPAVAPGAAGGLAVLDASSRILADAVAIGGQALGAKAGPNFNVFFHNANATCALVLSDLVTLAGRFTGITVLANWLRAGLRKSAAEATAKSEINSGGGGYDEATDSQEGIRDTTVEPAPVEFEITDFHFDSHSRPTSALRTYSDGTKIRVTIAYTAQGKSLYREAIEP